MPFLTRFAYLLTAVIASILMSILARQITSDPAIGALTFFASITILYWLLKHKSMLLTTQKLESQLESQFEFSATKKLTSSPLFSNTSSSCEIQVWIDEPKRKSCAIITSSQKPTQKKCVLNNFKCSQHIALPSNKKLLMLDDESNFLCIVDYSNDHPNSIFISHSSILSSEVYEGGTSVTQTKRLSQIGGVIVGGLVLGGAGAIIGGLSGKKKTSELTSDITLRLCINDTKNPIIDLQFLNEETAKNGDIYKHYSEQARRWHTILSILIKRADSESQQPETQRQAFNGSIADEIKKLSDLKESGAITDDEYTSLKSKLMN